MRLENEYEHDDEMRVVDGCEHGDWTERSKGGVMSMMRRWELRMVMQ
jgi:hypothetical protein